TITLTPYSDSPGAAVTVTTWGGEDIPGAPANLTLTDADGRPSLSWEAPVSGAHGGLYDTANIRYRVVRNNDNKEMARDLAETQWTDSEFSGTAAVSYSVYAYTAKGEGQPASSDKIVFGEGFKVPFLCGFDSADDFDLWTVVDLNGNSRWEYSATNKYIYSKYDDKGAADDWIFSPKFQAEKGKVYQLELDASVLQNSNPKYAENFEVWLSTTPSPAGKSVEILKCQGFLSKEVKKFKAFFKAPDNGWYHLGIYTDSPVTHWQLNIDNVGVSEIDSRVPAAVSGLSIVPASEGALSADISFKMPETDTENRALTEKLSVAVYTDQKSEPVYTAEELEAGATVNWTHTPEKSGVVTYRVVPSTPAGEGEEVSASAFVGVDAPGKPENLKALQNEAGDVVLTWDAPVKGMNGGWFDQSKLYYT
ncbi:MAG: choice-of-anchor J domain-containing protein, partial [Muribaculaceae bacterium]|nr:choice-of-anchor J domain-containing protein [Muribaculaceae bacterium]